jgi:Holliday junction resolvase RusA-like endonuclease
MQIELIIKGEPVAQPRAQIAIRKKTGKAVAFIKPVKSGPHPIHAYKLDIQAAWLGSPKRWPTPKKEKRRLFAVEIVFEFKAESEGWYTLRKNDADNCAKSCLDALNGLVWFDDGEVVSLKVERRTNPNPRTVIRITEAQP